MKPTRKPRGDVSLFTPGVDRRNFLRQVGSCAAATAVTASAIQAGARTTPVAAAGQGKVMLDQLNHATFAGLVGSTFHISVPGEGPRATAALELVEASLLPQSGRPAVLSRREPFSLIFRAAETQWPQRIYRLEHPSLGSFELFLVPIGADATGRKYEAIFN